MDIGQDLRYAARTLTCSRAFSLTVILVTALGVGANTAAFSVADFVLLRPLPFPDPDSLVRICEGPRTGGGGWGCMNQVSPANYRDFNEMSTSFAEMGALANDAVNLVGGGEPRRLAIARLNLEVMPLLGLAPVMGRVFETSDSGTNVAVLGFGLWQSQFGGNASVLGQKISLNGDPYTVIGVMPPAFYFPARETQMWTLLTFREENFSNRSNNYTEAVARLKPGVPFERAKAELEMIAERLARTYPETNEETDRVLDSVRTLPGVESAGFISGLPLVVTGLITGVEIPGQNMRNYRTNGVSHRWVTPGYFKTLGIPLQRGRDVEIADTLDRPWVAVVSQSFADRYWPKQDPFGKQFRHQNQVRSVVGIVGDVRVRGLERNSEPQMYLPAQQAPEGNPASFDPKDLVVRHTGHHPNAQSPRVGDPGQGDPLVAAIREIVRSADPEQPISDVRPLDAVLAGDTATRRAQLQVLGVLALVAVLLSGVGIYGLLAYMVSQRAREIGVRLALGAEPAQVGRMIFGDGMRLALFGIVPGVLAAYGVGRWMSALLFGVSPADPATFAAAVGVAIAITFAGSVIPALRAVRVTPMSVLKVE